MKQATPRAGGDSIIGHETISEDQIEFDDSRSAILADGTGYASILGEREEFV